MSTDGRLDADDAFEAVSRRASVIECLMDGPKYNRDLRDELDVSRSTAYKAVSELEELAIARRCDNGYELTLLGRLLFEQYREFHDRFAAICRPGELLAVLPREADIPFDVLDGAESHASERHAPNRPVREIERVVEDASVVKGTGPVVLPRYVELFSEQVVSESLDAELVFEQPVFEHLTTDYEADFSEAASSEHLSVWVTDSELPFGLLVVEAPTKKAGVIVYDSTGDIKGFVVNDTDRAYDWALGQWEQYREHAKRPSQGVPE